MVNLEVTSKESFDSVVQEFSKLGINSFDQVFYISGVLKGFGNILEVGIDVLKENIDVNLYGAYLATQAFVPFLEKSSEAKLSYISTDFASFALPIFEGHSQAFGTEGYDPTGSYNISKTALNRLGHEFHGILKPKGIAVLLIDPGQVKTDLNPWGQIEIEESAMGMYVFRPRLAFDVADNSESVQVTGKFRLEDDRYFVKYNGTPLPW